MEEQISLTPAERVAELLIKLTDKQRKFVFNIVKYNFQKHKAAVAAGYSKKTALMQASHLLQKPLVRQAINILIVELMADEYEELKLRTINELKEIAFFRMETVFNKKGEITLDSIKKAPSTAAIKSIIIEEDKETGNKKIKLSFHSKVQSLELMSKYLNILHKEIGDEETSPTNIYVTNDFAPQIENKPKKKTKEKPIDVDYEVEE